MSRKFIVTDFQPCDHNTEVFTRWVKRSTVVMLLLRVTPKESTIQWVSARNFKFERFASRLFLYPSEKARAKGIMSASEGILGLRFEGSMANLSSKQLLAYFEILSIAPPEPFEGWQLKLGRPIFGALRLWTEDILALEEHKLEEPLQLSYLRRILSKLGNYVEIFYPEAKAKALKISSLLGIRSEPIQKRILNCRIPNWMIYEERPERALNAKEIEVTLEDACRRLLETSYRTVLQTYWYPEETEDTGAILKMISKRNDQNGEEWFTPYLVNILELPALNNISRRLFKLRDRSSPSSLQIDSMIYRENYDLVHGKPMDSLDYLFLGKDLEFVRLIRPLDKACIFLDMYLGGYLKHLDLSQSFLTGLAPFFALREIYAGGGYSSGLPLGEVELLVDANPETFPAIARQHLDAVSRVFPDAVMETKSENVFIIRVSDIRVRPVRVSRGDWDSIARHPLEPYRAAYTAVGMPDNRPNFKLSATALHSYREGYYSTPLKMFGLKPGDELTKMANEILYLETWGLRVYPEAKQVIDLVLPREGEGDATKGVQLPARYLRIF